MIFGFVSGFYVLGGMMWRVVILMDCGCGYYFERCLL